MLSNKKVKVIRKVIASASGTQLNRPLTDPSLGMSVVRDTSSPTFKVTDTCPEDWRYISEGAATAVFSYVGRLRPPNELTSSFFDSSVLRLRKRKDQGCRLRDVKDMDEDDEDEDPIVAFQTHCAARLIEISVVNVCCGEHPLDPDSKLKFLPRLESVQVDRPWLERFVAVHSFCRRGGEKGDWIDFGKRKAVLATDLVVGEWITVEIKPKWGFLHSSMNTANFSEGWREIKTKSCRFCLHTRAKARAKSHAIGSVITASPTYPAAASLVALSQFCPLDLYSGDTPRVRRAVNALWDAWVACDGDHTIINNFKVFSRGRTVRPSRNALSMVVGSDITADGASDLLPNANCGLDLSLADIRDAFMSALIPILTKTPVFRILSHLQRTLDPLGIEGVSDLWREVVGPEMSLSGVTAGVPMTGIDGNEKMGKNLAKDPTMEELSKFLDIYHSQVGGDSGAGGRLDKVEELRYYLVAYLLSATFKDCSVMVRMDLLRDVGLRTPDGEDMTALKSEHRERTSSPFPQAFRKEEQVTLIDLDVKKMEKFARWEALHWEITNADVYAGGSMEVLKECVDSLGIN